MAQLLSLLQQIYPDNFQAVQSALSATFADQRLPQKKEANWYKKLQIYVVYPDTFHQGEEAGFDQLTSKLDYIVSLGMNTIHVLPFLASPEIDAGFDVSEYYLVREKLGGTIAFEKFLETAHSKGLNVFMDLVLNHISQEHRWFQQAISGDRFYRSFFESSYEKPTLVKRFSNEAGEWARYETEAGEKDLRIIFPDHCGEVPHWRQAQDGYWYYHTFYPQQLDVNWQNHHVFVAFAKVLAYWAKKGLNFRLDAIPFVGKDVSTGQVETTVQTHMIVQALHAVVHQVAPDNAFLVEANQPIPQMKAYFGTEATQFRSETKEAELAYNFPLMNDLWNSLVTQNAESLLSCIKEISKVPSWAGWITFLRNHDELSLEYAPAEIKSTIYEALVKNGLPFRGEHDVAGRTFSLLGNDSDKHLFAYFLLASMPGSPALIYGDELCKQNDYEFMKNQTDYKQTRLNDASIQDDSRDINRGWLDDEQINTKQARATIKEIQAIFTTRLEHLDTFLIDPVVKTKDNLLVLDFGSSLRVVLNISSQQHAYASDKQVLLKTAGVVQAEKQLTLESFSGVWLV